MSANFRRLAVAAAAWLLARANGFVPAVPRNCGRRVGSGAKRQSDYEYDNEDRRTKYTGGSEAEEELKRMARPNIDDWHRDEEYGDFKIDRRKEVSRGGKPTARNSRSPEYYYEDDDFDYEDAAFDEYYEPEDTNKNTGNFWSNPSSGVDRLSSPPRQRRSREMGDRMLPPARRSRPRTSIRPSGSVTSPIVSDFYNRFFWSGFDPSDTAGVGDKSIFGGTKGKFNGLAFMGESDSSQNRQKQLPPTRGGYVDEYDDGYFDVDEDYSMPTAAPVKPPVDQPMLFREEYPRDVKRRKRRRPIFNGDGEDEYDRNILDEGDDDYDEDDDLYAKENESRRVQERESYDLYDDDYSDDDRDGRRVDGRGRRDRRESRRRRDLDDSSPKWSPFDVLNSFLGVDRRKMKYQAERYNENMGITSGSGTKRRRHRQERPRRPGYAYRYDGSDDDMEPPVADFDPIDELPKEGEPLVENQKEPPSKPESSLAQRTREPSWEERSMTVQRVPPANIPAWGPSGDLGIDARTKAIEDALEDIQSATYRLTQRQKKESLAEEDMTILKVDAELQRRRIGERAQSIGIARERLRQVELDIEDAFRSLRRARTQTQIARDRLEELKERHWALLRLYTPDEATRQVDEALLEFQKIEPAARLDGFGDTRRSGTNESTKAPQATNISQDAPQQIDQDLNNP